MARATQVEVARAVGLDVSSVNKILNEIPGPVFAKSTIRRVKQVARRMGFRPRCIGCRVDLRAPLVSYKLPKGKRVCTYCAASVIAQVSNRIDDAHARGMQEPKVVQS